MSERLSRRAAVRRMAAAAAFVGASGIAPLTHASAPRTGTPPGTTATAGALQHSVCKWCYPDFTVEELAREVSRMGISSIELLDPDDWPALSKYDLVCAMANGPGGITEGWNRTEHHERLIAGALDRLPKVANAGYPNMIVFSGNRAGMDDEEGLENCAKGLKQIMSAAERHGVTVCMELLNSKVNHPDYMCDHTAWGAELVRRVGSERFKLLYDIYHMQIMEGDVIRTIRDNAEYIGHYHTAGNPGRNEIDETQELNYRAIAQAIKDTGFTGFIAQEFVPTRDPMVSLRQGVEICDV